MLKKISAKLQRGRVYSRAELQDIFRIKDATIKNGIFRPKGYDSVLIFITEQKTADRRQYKDKFDGQKLSMDGQPAGRTDKLIVEQEELGLELLLFHRKSKKEHPGAAFVFEGEFEYVSSEGSNPTQFRLRRKTK